MIRNAKDCGLEITEHLRGGDGVVKKTNFIASPDELAGKGRLFGKLTLEPGCSIGRHEHTDERELFYILSGVAEYDDNGTIRTLHPGDVSICPSGTSHSIANRGTETLEVIAVIVNE